MGNESKYNFTLDLNKITLLMHRNLIWINIAA